MVSLVGGVWSGNVSVMGMFDFVIVGSYIFIYIFSMEEGCFVSE